jgi:hypothetical protein
VDEILLGSAQKTLLGEEAVGGGIGKPVANTDPDACETEELASTRIGKEEFGMSDRVERQRRMTEVFVCGLNEDMKEEDVRSVFGWAGEITEVRMAMDARTSKSKGYCFVRYREPSQAKKVVAEFCKLKVVLTHLDIQSQLLMLELKFPAGCTFVRNGARKSILLILLSQVDVPTLLIYPNLTLV